MSIGLNQLKLADKNALINKLQMAGGNINSLSEADRNRIQSSVPPSELANYLNPSGGIGGSSGGMGSGSGGGNIDANSLMELYQKGLGAGATPGQSTDDQLRLMQKGTALDLQRKRAEQDMQMEGQKQALSQTQEARAKERETEAQLQRRQQSTERSHAMAAYKSL